MPFHKKVYKKKPYKGYNPKINYSILSKQINKLKENKESKIHNYEITEASNTNVTSGGVTYDLNHIDNGTFDTQRIGDKITMKSFFMRICLSSQGALPQVNVRIMIFYDRRQENATTPLRADILETASPLSLLARTNAGRFKVLYDKNITLSSQKPNIVLERYIKFNNVQVRYTGTGATNIAQNGLYMLVLCDQTVASEQPHLAMQARVRFTDS